MWAGKGAAISRVAADWSIAPRLKQERGFALSPGKIPSPPVPVRSCRPPSQRPSVNRAVSNAHNDVPKARGYPGMNWVTMARFIGVFPSRSALSLAPKIPPEISPEARQLGCRPVLPPVARGRIHKGPTLSTCIRTLYRQYDVQVVLRTCYVRLDFCPGRALSQRACVNQRSDAGVVSSY